LPASAVRTGAPWISMTHAAWSGPDEGRAGNSPGCCGCRPDPEEGCADWSGRARVRPRSCAVQRYEVLVDPLDACEGDTSENTGSTRDMTGTDLYSAPGFPKHAVRIASTKAADARSSRRSGRHCSNRHHLCNRCPTADGGSSTVCAGGPVRAQVTPCTVSTTPSVPALRSAAMAAYSGESAKTRSACSSAKTHSACSSGNASRTTF